MSELVLRTEQEQIIRYKKGKIGISAVPGSGKTWTLSLIAAEIINRGILQDHQEVLVVTLVNSAVDNFYTQVSKFCSQKVLLPLGFRVRTLHGLAHDIVKERPDLVGVGEDFTIVDELETNKIIEEAARAWIQTHPAKLDEYLNPELDEYLRGKAVREKIPAYFRDIATGFIRSVKDKRLSESQIRARLDEIPIEMPLVEMGYEIYLDYERSLNYRGAIDFDDLISYALIALENDKYLLERLQDRWPYILEDEAQDSSRLQEKILELLCARNGNWVRVGDPNQAIFETFTTADPDYLRNFILRNDVTENYLSVSGRSTESIIDLANNLVTWTADNHPIKEVRSGLAYPPLIQPTPQDDPQPNPPDYLSKIYISDRKLNPDNEMQVVVNSIARWLPDHQDKTVAVLVPRNDRGSALAIELQKANILINDDLLKVTSHTRRTVRIINNLLRFFAKPDSAALLSKVYEDWLALKSHNEDLTFDPEDSSSRIKKVKHLEDYVQPEPGWDWLEDLRPSLENEQEYHFFSCFREDLQRWGPSVTIPIDQMVLTITKELFKKPEDLALSYKLALILRQAGRLNPNWRVEDYSAELEIILRNRRRFLGLSDSDTGFNPEKHKGQVVISTMHKAKGLEWDRVYLMSVNNYNFPAGYPDEDYFDEKYFIREKLNLQAETLAQLEALFSESAYDWYQEGIATNTARLDYARERLRLLYVGITRAKKELIITWNTGRKGNNTAAIALLELLEFNHKKMDSE
jgi:DNA helicase-2/ATP-dependent DNA helicase PcrA